MDSREATNNFLVEVCPAVLHGHLGILYFIWQPYLGELLKLGIATHCPVQMFTPLPRSLPSFRYVPRGRKWSCPVPGMAKDWPCHLCPRMTQSGAATPHHPQLSSAPEQRGDGSGCSLLVQAPAKFQLLSSRAIRTFMCHKLTFKLCVFSASQDMRL